MSKNKKILVISIIIGALFSIANVNAMKNKNLKEPFFSKPEKPVSTKQNENFNNSKLMYEKEFQNSSFKPNSKNEEIKKEFQEKYEILREIENNYLKVNREKIEEYKNSIESIETFITNISKFERENKNNKIKNEISKLRNTSNYVKQLLDINKKKEKLQNFLHLLNFMETEYKNLYFKPKNLFEFIKTEYKYNNLKLQTENKSKLSYIIKKTNEIKLFLNIIKNDDLNEMITKIYEKVMQISSCFKLNEQEINNLNSEEKKEIYYKELEKIENNYKNVDLKTLEEYCYLFMDIEFFINIEKINHSFEKDKISKLSEKLSNIKPLVDQEIENIKKDKNYINLMKFLWNIENELEDIISKYTKAGLNEIKDHDKILSRIESIKKNIEEIQNNKDKNKLINETLQVKIEYYIKSKINYIDEIKKSNNKKLEEAEEEIKEIKKEIQKRYEILEIIENNNFKVDEEEIEGYIYLINSIKQFIAKNLKNTESSKTEYISKKIEDDMLKLKNKMNYIKKSLNSSYKKIIFKKFNKLLKTTKEEYESYDSKKISNIKYHLYNDIIFLDKIKNLADETKNKELNKTISNIKTKAIETINLLETIEKKINKENSNYKETPEIFYEKLENIGEKANNSNIKDLEKHLNSLNQIECFINIKNMNPSFKKDKISKLGEKLSTITSLLNQNIEKIKNGENYKNTDSRYQISKYNLSNIEISYKNANLKEIENYENMLFKIMKTIENIQKNEDEFIDSETQNEIKNIKIKIKDIKNCLATRKKEIEEEIKEIKKLIESYNKKLEEIENNYKNANSKQIENYENVLFETMKTIENLKKSKNRFIDSATKDEMKNMIIRINNIKNCLETIKEEIKKEVEEIEKLIEIDNNKLEEIENNYKNANSKQIENYENSLNNIKENTKKYETFANTNENKILKNKIIQICLRTNKLLSTIEDKDNEIENKILSYNKSLDNSKIELYKNINEIEKLEEIIKSNKLYEDESKIEELKEKLKLIESYQNKNIIETKKLEENSKLIESFIKKYSEYKQQTKNQNISQKLEKLKDNLKFTKNRLKIYKKFKEIEKLIITYNEMLQNIENNYKNANSQQIKNYKDSLSKIKEIMKKNNISNIETENKGYTLENKAKILKEKIKNIEIKINDIEKYLEEK